MPRYDYKCPTCGKVIEVTHKMDETLYPTCFDCSDLMEKQVSVPVLQFKGSGFYITDYKKSEKIK